MVRIVCLAVGYFLGCVQSAYIVGKLMGHIDIRDFGSGNAGTTNVTRVLGFKSGVIVFIADILKAILAFVICSLIFKGGGTFFSGTSLVPGMYAGIGVIIGHNFPFYLKFKGGKGIASTIGLIVCIDLKIAVITYVIGLLIVLFTRYISLASLTMTLLATILMIIFKFETEAVFIMALLTLMAYYRHIPNIKRLIKGEENKFSIYKKKSQ